jgi:hypothetical protein
VGEDVMTDLRKAAQQVLKTWDTDDWFDSDTLRAALKTQPKQTAMEPDIAKVLFDNVESLYIEDAQPEPEQEPVAWIYEYTNPRREKAVGFYPSQVNGVICTPLYTTPPERKPLTDEEMDKIWFNSKSFESIVRAVEKAHGIGVE